MTFKVLIISMVLFISTTIGLAATDVWSSHIAATAGWKTTISVCNTDSTQATFTLNRLDDSGSAVGTPKNFQVTGKTWQQVTSTDLNYNGVAHITSTADLLVKVTYRYGESYSLCEFYLTGNTGRNWVIPNSVQDWLDYTGIALFNPTTSSISATLEAWQSGAQVGLLTVSVPALSRYVRLSDGIWTGLPYENFDTIYITTSQSIPPPISITGNNAQDRHVFFTAQPNPTATAGTLYSTDAIVGNMRYVPGGTFTQGSPSSEPCRNADYEAQFTHTLTRNMAVMETEITRKMWADLKALCSTSPEILPNDPSDTTISSGNTYPVQKVLWQEAVLFANLLSLRNGLTPCYYLNSGFTTRVDSTNYNSTPVYCNFNATGYRLPTEGEWEYFCRAGTTGAFWIDEPNYTDATCNVATPPAGTYAQLETAAWFLANNSPTGTKPVAGKAANPWGLYDIHGNVGEFVWDLQGHYPTGTQTDYTGPTVPLSTNHGARSVGYRQMAKYMRCANRLWVTENVRIDYVGFRLIRTVQ